ncbi:hypothetical protein NUW58_g2054 [Xylaria curta]|uniref:Uncharacterized protein n=1 Tax=Xylaria curta TaxID=42375 RepID=A0ACC1PJZ4_9PEZI|nr:hypothetical protein NUW58_g2054 [Xylaria curta]
MARSKKHAQQLPSLLIDFKFLVTQMRRRLKTEGGGGHRAFDREMAIQFTEAVADMAPRRRPKSSLFFQWRLFANISNHFWPGSVMQGDRPSVIQETSKPLINPDTYRTLDTNAASFEQIVDFIQCNGQGPFRWPKKSKAQKRADNVIWELRGKAKRPGNVQSNPIVISPLPSPLRRPSSAYNMPRIPSLSTDESPHIDTHVNLWSPAIWDDDVVMVEGPQPAKTYATFITKPQSPKLSVACQPGWDLNNKTIWIPVAGVKCDDAYVRPDRTASDQPFGPPEPPLWGKVSFTTVPESDKEAFLCRFLGRDGASTGCGVEAAQ